MHKRFFFLLFLLPAVVFTACKQAPVENTAQLDTVITTQLNAPEEPKTTEKESEEPAPQSTPVMPADDSDQKTDNYLHGEDGTVIGYARRAPETGGSTVTREAAIALAWEHGRSVYGSRLDGYIFSDCTAAEEYTVYYQKAYGAGGFIKGESQYLCKVALNGAIIRSALSIDRFSDFNAALVEALTEEQLSQEIIAYFQAQHPDSALNILGVSLKKTNDQYLLAVTAEYHGSDASESARRVMFLYDPRENAVVKTSYTY